jgi:hypothetical protein
LQHLLNCHANAVFIDSSTKHAESEELLGITDGLFGRCHEGKSEFP